MSTMCLCVLASQLFFLWSDFKFNGTSGLCSVIRTTLELDAEFCRDKLILHRRTPTNACRAELGRYQLINNIRSCEFWSHFKSSPPHTVNFQSLQTQEVNPEKILILSAGPKLLINQHPTLFNLRPTPLSSHQSEKAKPWIQISRSWPNRLSDHSPTIVKDDTGSPDCQQRKESVVTAPQAR